jgi:hypothetical protein
LHYSNIAGSPDTLNHVISFFSNRAALFIGTPNAAGFRTRLVHDNKSACLITTFIHSLDDKPWASQMRVSPYGRVLRQILSYSYRSTAK